MTTTGHAQQPAPQAPLPPGQTNNPFPQPIVAGEGVIVVTLRQVASLPDIDGVAARAMTLVDEPSTRRLFVSDMRGVLYVVSPDGGTVTPWLDLREPKWAVPVQSQGRERGVQSFDVALLNLFKQNRIELEEALANADSRSNLEAKINFG